MPVAIEIGMPAEPGYCRERNGARQPCGMSGTTVTTSNRPRSADEQEALGVGDSGTEGLDRAGLQIEQAEGASQLVGVVGDCCQCLTRGEGAAEFERILPVPESTT